MSCILLHGNEPAEVDELWELPASTVKKWFSEGRYGRLGTIGDGSCFFHSVCKALDHHNYSKCRTSKRQDIIRAFRKVLGDKFTRNSFDEISKVSKSTKRYEEIKEMFEDPQVWAEEVMIRWCSEALHANIVFLNLSDNANTMYCGVHDKSTAESMKRCEDPKIPTIIVAWINKMHFELIVRIDAVEAHRIKIKKMFVPDNSEDLMTINNLMRAYASACKI